MEHVDNTKRFHFPLGLWLLLALVVHWLAMWRLPGGVWWERSHSARRSAIEVVLAPEFSKTFPKLPASKNVSDAAESPIVPPPVKEKQKFPAPPQPQVRAPEKSEAETGTSRSQAHVPVQRPAVDARKLKESLRQYRLPEQDASRPFTRLLPRGIDAEAFSANTAARINARIQAYDGQGGAQVVRVHRFGKKDRCYLVHRTGFEVEREDWDPGPATLVGYGAEEITCD